MIAPTLALIALQFGQPVVTPSVYPPHRNLLQWEPIEPEYSGWGPPMTLPAPTNPPRADLIDALDLEMPTLPADLSGVSRVRVVVYGLAPGDDPDTAEVLYTVFSGDIAKHRIVYEGDGEGGVTLAYEVRIVDSVFEKHHLYREHRADFNGDRMIDSTDMAMLLADWGPTP